MLYYILRSTTYVKKIPQYENDCTLLGSANLNAASYAIAELIRHILKKVKIICVFFFCRLEKLTVVWPGIPQ